MADHKILIVEDERPLAHALELKLQHEGLQTTVVHDGQSAVDILKQDVYDVMLLDMMMPVLDGFHVLKAIEDFPNKPTVFVISNLSQPEDESLVIAAGAAKYFVKSDTPLATIVAEVQKVL